MPLYATSLYEYIYIYFLLSLCQIFTNFVCFSPQYLSIFLRRRLIYANNSQWGEKTAGEMASWSLVIKCGSVLPQGIEKWKWEITKMILKPELMSREWGKQTLNWSNYSVLSDLWWSMGHIQIVKVQDPREFERNVRGASNGLIF